MTYLDAIESEVSKTEAIQELKMHNADLFAFFAEVGERESYQGSEVLDWLGY